MPEFTVASKTHDIRRDAIMLDTNVLVDAFEPGHADNNLAARFLLYESERQLIIPSVIVVEAWGLLTSRHGWDSARDMLIWLGTPSADVVVVLDHRDHDEVFELLHSLHLDYVDSVIARLGTAITKTCALNPVIPVATRDYRDFNRILKADDVELQLLDYTALDWA